MARVRKNVWNIVRDPGDDTLEWYARGVAAMQARPFTDPTSWRFQAAIHGWSNRPDLAPPGVTLPSSTMRDEFFAQCQHGHWFFLPWHRMYLHHFEQILLDAIVADGGPDDWALPYWNYGTDPAAEEALLPTPFRDPDVNGAPNPLFVADRDPAANAGQPFSDAIDLSLDCLLADVYFDPTNQAFRDTFGGAATAPAHFLGGTGLLEGTPHNRIHVAVSGWMSDPDTAALDPIFWLHHSNIDRLWEVWLAKGNTNPTHPLWLDRFTFPFVDKGQNPVTMRCRDIIDPAAAPLDYEYDDINDPLLSGLVPMGGGALAMPELLGATIKPMQVGVGRARANVATAGVSAGGLVAMGSPTTPTRVVLSLEHMTCDVPVPAIDVYIGIPGGSDPVNPEQFAGRLSLFGINTASRSDGPHAGSGLNASFDVTDLVARLQTQPGWDPEQFDVVFVPVKGDAPKPLNVGRISLYAA